MLFLFYYAKTNSLIRIKNYFIEFFELNPIRKTKEIGIYGKYGLTKTAFCLTNEGYLYIGVLNIKRNYNYIEKVNVETKCHETEYRNIHFLNHRSNPKAGTISICDHDINTILVLTKKKTIVLIDKQTLIVKRNYVIKKCPDYFRQMYKVNSNQYLSLKTNGEINIWSNL